MAIQSNSLFAKAEMLIRRPAAEVFNAFVDPAVTTQFWFTKSSGMLENGKEIEWVWEMYRHTVRVKVLELRPGEKIVIEWDNTGERSMVTWTFKALSGTATFVSVVNEGLEGDDEKAIALVRDSTEGFTLVLAGLKALLEHGIQLNLVADRFPEGIQ